MESRHHYYLQLKRNVLQSKVPVQDEVIFTLAAAALHVDMGPFDPSQHKEKYFDPHDYVPAWVSSLPLKNKFTFEFLKFNYQLVSSVVKTLLSGGRSGVRFPGRSNRQSVARLQRFFRSGLAQALSRGDVSRHSLHALAYFHEYYEVLIWFDL